MNRTARALVLIYSLILGILSMILLYAYINRQILTNLVAVLELVISDSSISWFLLVFLLLIIFSATWNISHLIISGRLGKTRVHSTELGLVDIDADAIESIALNSAKMAQAGIKSAKARVFSGKDKKIRLVISAVLYANIEIPAMMNKIQERVKKDIERYTGIQVEDVSVKVTRVEPVVAKVER